MALLYIDGFDWIINSDITENYQGRWANNGGVPGASGVLRLTDTASGIGAAVRLRGNNALLRSVPGASATLYGGFRFRVQTVSNAYLYYWRQTSASSGGVHLALRINAGVFQLLRGTSTLITTGSFSVPSDTWFYVEYRVTIANSGGRFQLWINGSATADIDYTGDTQNGGVAQIDSVNLLGSNDDLDFDDLYLDDAQNHGDVVVETILPDGAGASAQFTPSAGANYAAVDDNPHDGDTTYVESVTSAHKDRHTHGNITGSVDTILGVQVGAMAKKTTSGTRSLKMVAYDGTTEGVSAALSPSLGDYSWLTALFEDHPTSAAAWTESEVNSGEFGYEIG